MFDGGTLGPREGEFVRDVLLTAAVKGCLQSRLLPPASKDRSRTSRLSHSAFLTQGDQRDSAPG